MAPSRGLVAPATDKYRVEPATASYSLEYNGAEQQ